MTSRIKRLRSEFARFKNIDALLITNDTNIRYLTSFDAHESWMLVLKDKSFYITDFRYIEEARQGLKGVILKKYNQTPCVTLFDLCKKYKVKRLGFDERHTTVCLIKKLKEFCPKHRKLVPATGIVEDLREIKDNSEINLIKACLNLHKKALAYLKKVVKPGISEREILFKLERFVKSNKAKFSFDPIIASGPNSAYPHAKVTDRIVRNNESVLIDFGIDINGYKSDLTRNFFLGRISPSYARVLKALKEAQAQAIAMIKPGVAVADIDAKARNVLRKYGLAKYFGHSLGHGVGLDIHENPRLSVKCNCLLQPGMVVTVEPGVYLPGKFGIRVEDMVLVTNENSEVLSVNIH